MQIIEKQRERLIKLLRELFQLDQPDLDFGLYRIMNAKASQINKFLEEDLLGIIHEAFGEADEKRIAEAHGAYKRAKKDAIDFDAPDPEATRPVKEAKAAYDAAKEGSNSECEVYDHLYRFFERYYDNGDFMSRRYFARETDGKAAPYAIPYDGREVYFHWSNRDQYYIKTSDHLSNFSFDPTQTTEFKNHSGGLFEDKPTKVHFRIVSASEGEHNNVKPTDQTERYFIIDEAEPVKLETDENGSPELVIQFQYRTDPQKKGQEGIWRRQRLAEAAEKIKEVLPKLEGAEDFVKILMTPAPTSSESNRTLLDKYLAQYTARNTMDYFIHKDLGGFLRRELDFYIKNEMMRLDDIVSAEVPSVESYLAKIRVLRKIAQHLIDFLAQLEEFQKSLWLKKKFVVDTQYCISLDRIPKKFYKDIVANESQRENWVQLFSIDELDGYSSPLSTNFLINNQKLPVDTGLFKPDFRDQLIAELENLDQSVEGILIHSENSQGLRFLTEKMQRSVDAIYIDPPYNTVHSEIIYKNGYKHSSWLCLIKNGIEIVPSLWAETFSFGAAINDYEHVRLAAMLRAEFPSLEHSTVIVNHHPGGAGGRLSRTHEYYLLAAPSNAPQYLGAPKENKSEHRAFMRSGSAENNYRRGRWKSFYPLLLDPSPKLIDPAPPPPLSGKDYPTCDTEDGLKRIYPISGNDERVWRSSYETGKQRAKNGELIVSKSGTVYQIVDNSEKRQTLLSNWTCKKYNAGTYGTNILSAMGLKGEFDYPKSIHTMVDGLWMQTYGRKEAVVLDYFGGSGTTAHAVIDVRREYNDIKWKYLLIEMGDYFDTVTRPRTLKASYSSEWVEGKPVKLDGQSHISKYLRLESYEDTLNNLKLKNSRNLAQTDHNFQQDYMLRYWMNFETKASPSLLNIERFADPTNYKLKIKKPGSDEYAEKNVDLVETFNWLIGLHVEHLDAWHGYDASFYREPDPELPNDTNTRLILKGDMNKTKNGKWQFRKIVGYTLRTPGNTNDREKVLVIWRSLTDNIEKDNAILDEWFKNYCFSMQNDMFDVIYVNGTNNLLDLQKGDERWTVRLIEEAFHQSMWDVEN